MTTATTDDALHDLVEKWSPPKVEVSDVVSLHRARELAATLDLGLEVADGAALPLLWHWTCFLEWAATRDLGVDGHPREGNFLPPMPNRRRMFAGGRVDVKKALSVGEVTVRRSTVLETVVKRGRMGALLFVTLRHEYLQGDELRVSEEQDIVYRSEATASPSQPPLSGPLGEGTATWAMKPKLHPALLFRFSALTGNTHRIHYDHPYTTGVEGFPALVVQGPLLAIFMAEVARANGGEIRAFAYRLSRPVYVDDAIRVQGHPSGDRRTATLEVVSGEGTVHATASVEFA
ncbi:MaoC/PaaZ C-terminal domain-containing protein [Mycobacterium sp. AT1]|uniref:MaoC/PaaZ C-terminal domain-containing protein n=1 Tax=Mycobacterium sp. AT1 TaxID=1961706 RepID=UPI0009AE39BD|nr:MaoC/PaaZ C-terminal domain-containing protein [Mycobacterium sp. AT1]OPX12338.1 hypothetical protein B1790_04005 [Mycobacterium sp. AT1]